MGTANIIKGEIQSVVQMPDTCKDCGKTWYMSRSQYEILTRLCKNKPDYKMPVRCGECKRKRAQSDLKMLQADSLTRMDAIIVKVKEGRFAFKDVQLARELTDLKNLMRSIIRKVETLYGKENAQTPH